MLKTPLTEKEISYIPKTGFYKSEEEFLADAFRTLLSARKDLRESLACLLYKEGIVSLGKAAEIAFLPLEEFKKLLFEKRILRNILPLEKEKSLLSKFEKSL